jgi:flavin reductase (DIM6/NTAB) family NADH-FMN oxidoreductase RutF
MELDLSKATQRQVYNLLIGLVVPRPIALITSKDPEGRLNAAPFSAYNYLGTDPAVVAIGVQNRPDAGAIGKDTAQNIRRTREFVINVVHEPIAQAMNICATDFPQGTNELEKAGLTTMPSVSVSVPRIAESPANLECREFTTLEIGNSRVILGIVVHIHVKDEFLDPAGPYIRAEEMHAIGRMNGLGNYIRTRDFLQIPRISYSEWLEKGKNKE